MAHKHNKISGAKVKKPDSPSLRKCPACKNIGRQAYLFGVSMSCKTVSDFKDLHAIIGKIIKRLEAK